MSSRVINTYRRQKMISLYNQQKLLSKIKTHISERIEYLEKRLELMSPLSEKPLISSALIEEARSCILDAREQLEKENGYAMTTRAYLVMKKIDDELRQYIHSKNEGVIDVLNKYYDSVYKLINSLPDDKKPPMRKDLPLIFEILGADEILNLQFEHSMNDIILLYS